MHFCEAELGTLGSPSLLSEAPVLDPLDTSLSQLPPSSSFSPPHADPPPLASAGSSGSLGHVAPSGPGYVELCVHGVEEVGDEISVQLRRLLESRLAEFALTLLSELLSRNPLFQLTHSDMDLIRAGSHGATAGRDTKSGTERAHSGGGGASGANVTRALLELPRQLLRDPYLFMLYLRQNVARAQFINNLHVQQGQGTGGLGPSEIGRAHV